MKLTEQEIYKLALKKWGMKRQIIIFMEEIGELLQAVSKVYRSPKDVQSRDNLAEEIADVEIMTGQMKILLNVSGDTINAHKKRKLAKLEQHLTK